MGLIIQLSKVLKYLFMHLVVMDGEHNMGYIVFHNNKLIGFIYNTTYSILEGNNLQFYDNLKVVTLLG